jgi:hypothetical protein
MKVFFTTSTPTYDSSKGRSFPAIMRHRHERCPLDTHQVIDDPEQADLIIFWEDDQSEETHNTKLRRHALVARHREKCFMYSASDHPIPWLPGVFTSLPWSEYDPWRCRSGCYVLVHNELVAEHAGQSPLAPPKLLMSFRGAIDDNPFRQQLVAHDFKRDDVHIESAELWRFNQTILSDKTVTDGQLSYIKLIQDSRFVLCPRGLGTSTIRLFEVMCLGRVPVILADDWVPPQGPTWSDFSIRVAQAKFRQLPEILARYENRHVEMGLCAREAYLRWYAPEMQAHRIIEDCVELSLMRTRSEEQAHHEMAGLERRIAARFAIRRVKGSLRSLITPW